jgi:trans-aconitate 2-methyltransferase
MSWSPDQYTKFEDQRTRPVRDLLAAVPTRQVARAVDLGCGPGNSTEVLAALYPEAEVVGVDNSEPMLVAARKRCPAIRFEAADIEAWDDAGPFDLILANAALQWVGDHRSLLPRLVERLSPGGALAVQMPDNLDQPSHALMRKTAEAGPWAARLAAAGEARTGLLGVGGYYDLLRPLCAKVDIWRTVYQHPLPGVGAIVEWFKASGLRPYLAALNAEEQADFLARYEEALKPAYPLQANGEVLLAFPRLFFVAVR